MPKRSIESKRKVWPDGDMICGVDLQRGVEDDSF